MPARVMMAALKSGSGKTTITCGLLECLKRNGDKVTAFKCGPDYIDPMFHRKVIGIASNNLDTFFSSEEQIKDLYMSAAADSDISVVEGVMGLYDGLGGIRKEGSSYHLAQTLKMPIILVIDAHGMGRTMIPVIAGMLSYDTDHLIKGIIINKTSKMFAETIGNVIEEELKIPVIGYVPKISDIVIDSRHLGLKLPEEIADLQKQLSTLADRLEESIDMNKLIQIAKTAPELEPADEHAAESDIVRSEPSNGIDKELKIAVAMDEAFNFYYAENFRMLEKYGAKLEFFSPIHDEKLPENIDGLIMGGGYPELKAKELSENISMRTSIKEALAKGLPSHAECGGFMYLQKNILLEDGNSYEMVGAVDSQCEYKGKLVRFGYVDVREKSPTFLGEGEVIKAHEFHYFDSSKNGDSAVATKPVTGRNWDCIHIDENHWWGYPHLYYPSNPSFVKHFMEKCMEYQNKKL